MGGFADDDSAGAGASVEGVGGRLVPLLNLSLIMPLLAVLGAGVEAVGVVECADAADVEPVLSLSFIVAVMRFSTLSRVPSKHQHTLTFTHKQSKPTKQAVEVNEAEPSLLTGLHAA